MWIIRAIAAACMTLAMAAAPAAQQPAASDSQPIIDFQRALDAYAFQHRQVERRAGEGAGEAAMAAGMRATRPAFQDGDIFSPLVAAAFRARIAKALRGDCRLAAVDDGQQVVPRPNQPATGTMAVPGCLAAVLPRLPEEMEYRVAGVVLLLVDTHANLVVDVLHGAFAPPEMR